MSIYYQDDNVTLHLGDMLDVLRDLPDASVDAVVTDPPYGIRFMGQAWDGADIQAGVELRRSQAAMPDDGKAGQNGGYRSAAAEAGRYDQSLTASQAFQQWCTAWATECLRILKPGGHLLSFGGSRTWHRLAAAVEDAGFELRDSIAWLYGSGFPKSLDVSKAIDKRGGRPDLAEAIAAAIKAAREARGIAVSEADRTFCGGSTNWTWYEGRKGVCHPPTPETFARIVAEWPELSPWAGKVAEAEREVIGERTTGRRTGRGDVAYIGDSDNRDVTAPATDAARQWQGWGTALKPAFEPIVVGRKPLTGTVAANVLEHGTGALNIDACRIGDETRVNNAGGSSSLQRVSRVEQGYRDTVTASVGEAGTVTGRWPTNVVLDDAAAAALDEQHGELTSGSRKAGVHGLMGYQGAGPAEMPAVEGDSGGASRYFPTFRYEAKADAAERPRVAGVSHPTVKPLDLMRWLVRLATSPGATVLEPFAGSGTTVEACVIEGFRCIAIEREADYLPLIEARIARRTNAARALELAGEDMGLFGFLDDEDGAA